MALFFFRILVYMFPYLFLFHSCFQPHSMFSPFHLTWSFRSFGSILTINSVFGCTAMLLPSPSASSFISHHHTWAFFLSSCTYHIPLVEPTGIRIAHSTYIIIHPHHTYHAAPNSSSLFAIISYPHMRFSLLFSQSLRRKQIYVFEYFIGIFAPFSSVSSISRRLANPSCSCSILSHPSIQPIR